VIAVDLDAVCDAWALPRPRTFAPTEAGYQNLTRFVSCAAGEFVLRVYRNVAAPSHQRFEHELLARLATADLSFAVPRPLPSRDGDTLPIVNGRLAALFPRIAGAPLPKDGGAYVTAAAAALAELDLAMGALDRFAHRPPVFGGDPARMHPLVTDLDDAAHDQRLALEHADELTEALAMATDLAAPIYASLPQQVTYGDFAFGNTLARDGRITGLLDFEHSGIDVRAMDLGVALYRFPAYPNALAECERFGRAYSRVLPLDATELAALPALLRVRAAVSFAHWIGRYRAGLATVDDVRPRAGRALFTAEWVDANGELLVRNALSWTGERV
jgi:Ser/Thr protein kinase RdoA (MazF antagonist)